MLEGEDPYMLFGVRDATKLPDGRIVVVNAGTMELRVFDALGTHLATWGGRGEGPGEFRNLVRVEPFPGDSSTLDSIYESRLDVIDLQSGMVVARAQLPGAFETFVGDGLLLQYRELPNAERLAVWRVTIDGR